MNSNAKTKLTNPLRPAERYRKGKAPTNVIVSDESDSDEQQQQDEEEENQIIKPGSEFDSDEEDQKPFINNNASTSINRKNLAVGKGKKNVGQMAVNLREVEVDATGLVRVGGKDEVGRTGRELEESSEEGKRS